jgi:hypothetical protein
VFCVCVLVGPPPHEGIAVLDESGARCLGLKRTGRDIPGKEGAAEDEMMDERRTRSDEVYMNLDQARHNA